MSNAYLVQRQGNNVYIREVDPDSCAFTFTKREGWEHAKNLAKPAIRARPKRPAADNITFIDIQGNRKVVA